MPRRILPFIIGAGIIAALLIFFAYCAPLEPASVTLYAGFTIACFGALCVLKPIRFFGVRKRRSGALLIVAGVAVAFIGLSLPARSVRIASRVSRLDDFMPQYDFYEVHDVRVHASSDRAAAAIQATTLEDIKVYETLMRLRLMASGKFRYKPARAGKPVLEVFKSPKSGFVLLSEEPREVVMGLAGAAWKSGPPPKVLNAAEWVAFQDPGAIKVAFNLRVVDDGPGWSRVVTETRVRALSDTARRIMARYWRAIYPGSGLIRRSWLNAIRDRAERVASTSVAAG